MFSTEQVQVSQKWFYAILFRYMSNMATCSACITVISVKNSNVKENTKPREATDLTNLPYIGNFSRREILVKMRNRRCVKFSPCPIFAFSMTLNEDVEFIFLCVYFWRFQGGHELIENETHAKNSRYTVKLAKSINTCTWNMATEASDCLKHIGVCRTCI